MKKQIIICFILLVVAAGIYTLYKSSDKEKLFTMMDVPEFELINQDEAMVSNQKLLGKVYVVEFFFTNCPTICPIMNQNLIEIEKEIDHPDFGVVSITIDPKNDTSEVLKNYAENYGITNPNWHFLTGDRNYIVDLSKKFNIYVGEDASTAEGLNHSGKIALIDRNGKIRSRFRENGLPLLYYSGLNYTDPEGKNESLSGTYHPQIDWLKEDIKKLLEE